MIRKVRIEDAQQLVDIYNFYVLNTVVTFDDVPFPVDAFIEKIESIYKIQKELVNFKGNNYCIKDNIVSKEFCYSIKKLVSNCFKDSTIKERENIYNILINSNNLILRFGT